MNVHVEEERTLTLSPHACPSAIERASNGSHVMSARAITRRHTIAHRRKMRAPQKLKERSAEDQ